MILHVMLGWQYISKAEQLTRKICRFLTEAWVFVVLQACT